MKQLDIWAAGDSAAPSSAGSRFRLHSRHISDTHPIMIFHSLLSEETAPTLSYQAFTPDAQIKPSLVSEADRKVYQVDCVWRTNQ